MRAVAQRCRAARVEVAGEIVGEIGPGLCAFVGAGKGDGEREAAWVVDKLANLRVFADADGRMSRSLLDTGGGLLVVSQFTLYGDARKGRRPGFDAALDPALAQPLLERVVELARQRCMQVAAGRFGADMRVIVDNDGPITILLDSNRTF